MHLRAVTHALSYFYYYSPHIIYKCVQHKHKLIQNKVYVLFFTLSQIFQSQKYSTIFFSLLLSVKSLFFVFIQTPNCCFSRDLCVSEAKRAFSSNFLKKTTLSAMRTNLRLYKIVKHLLSNPIIKVKLKQRSDQNLINSCFAYHFIWRRIWLFFKFLLILWNVVQILHYSY